MMKVFCETPPDLSKAMGRVVAALKRNATREVLRSVQFVDEAVDAELVFLHVIGYPETDAVVNWLLAHGKRYVVIQYCMRSTQRPHTSDWKRIWEQADMVWSYYDLPAMIRADGSDINLFNFYHSPLGVDRIFAHTEPKVIKNYTMLSSGYVAESEGVGEVAEAVRRIGGRHFHLGPKDAAPNADLWGLGLSDPMLADVYSRCCFVAGLRRAEGFEMPAAEGLVCGARPIMFDAVHYRQWYDSFAEFIPEGSFDEVVTSIVDVFQRGLRPVTEDERQAAIKRFDWSNIIPGLWEGVL